MKNKTIFFTKWPSTGCLDTNLAKSLDQTFKVNSKITVYIPITYLIKYLYTYLHRFKITLKFSGVSLHPLSVLNA